MADERTISRSGRTHDRRRQIVAFLGILLSFMIFLSLLSYSPADQTSADIKVTDLWKVFSADEIIQAKVARTQNWLGLGGALVSSWLINSTIGYGVILLPVFGIAWSWMFLRRRPFRQLIILTNYTLVLVVLFSALSGSIRRLGDVPIIPMEWSGAVGDFLAAVLSSLLGLVGTFILLFGCFALLLILLFDLDVQQAALVLRRWIVAGTAMGRSFILRTKAGWQEKRKERVSLRKTIHIKGTGDEVSAHSTSRSQPPQVFPKTSSTEVKQPEDLSMRTGGEGKESLQASVEQELQLNIREGIKEAEVDFDRREREVIEEEIDFVPPSVDLLDPARVSEEVDTAELEENAKLLQEKLADFGVQIETLTVTPGPVVTLYELVPASGVKISRIESLENDMALALKAKGIRIIAPIPGKGTVGVEIPNHNPSLVTIRSVINSSKFRDSKAVLPLAMGKTISGEVFVDDLARMPHLLIAGATGSGKSVGINTILIGLIYRLHPSDVKFVIIDPKKIELSLYAKLRRHYLAACPDVDEEIITTPANAVLALKSVEIEMEKRYDRLAAAGVRNIADYNERVRLGRLHDTDNMKHGKIPYLVVVIDELADLMITAAGDVEEPIARLAQLARAVGIHLVLATQRPSVDVITGVIKANFPARIAYQVASKTDSRTILDMNGAEQLLGSGDMLYLPSGSPKPIRLQNAYISTDEVERVMNHIAKQKGYNAPMKLASVLEKRKSSPGSGEGGRDELFEEAARIIVRHQQGSVSLLQRRLKVGYSRAARLVDELEAAGIVGPFDGSKAREVLVESEAELEAILKGLYQ
jgi:S-DNA-T family DNA segregation ATPase FtsK/SpoIIIE